MPLLNRIDVADPASAHSFIEGINLPEITSAARERMSAETGGTPPVYQEGENQAVAIGSQIVEFTADLPAELRPQIANSFLLAQLAANRAAETAAGSSAWYRAYLEVLANTGWIIERDETSERKMSDVSGEVHKEIIPLLTVLLGPGVAAAAMVTAVLEGLSNIDKDRPWITLFDRESRRASANQFQISHAATNGTALQVRLACLELEAAKTLTQVLFFKSSDTQAVLHGFGASLSLNAPVFERNKALIEDKVAEYVTGYIRGIEL